MTQNSHLDDGFIPVSLFTMPSLGLQVVSLVASCASAGVSGSMACGIDLTSNWSDTRSGMSPGLANGECHEGDKGEALGI